MTADVVGPAVARWQGDERGPYIRVYPSCTRFYLRNPTPDQFRPRDIAHHLAGVMRYTGGSRYSVAQHCVVASRMARMWYTDYGTLPRKMLIHDVAEAFYGDMSSPLKRLCDDYRVLERRADAMVQQVFGETFVGDPVVKEIDDRMWLTESRLLFGSAAHEDYDDSRGTLAVFPQDMWSIHEDFVPWSPERAEVAWLAAFRTLFPEVTDR